MGSPACDVAEMKVYCATIAWRSVHAEHMKCVNQLFRYANLTYRLQNGDALIERSRAIIATHFLRETDADVLVTIDDDVLFASTSVMKVAEQAMTYDNVAGLYMTRGNPVRPASMIEEGVKVDLTGLTDLVPIKYAATGFLATHRRVFEKLAQGMPLCHPKEEWRFYPFYTPFVANDDDGDPILLSEDYAFAERARMAGFGMYANPAIRLVHIGEYKYRTEDIGLKIPQEAPLSIVRHGAHGYTTEWVDEPELVTA